MVASAVSSTALSAEALAEVVRLATTDRRVRAHEQAHMAVGGRYVRGGPSYSYVTGPDGKRYAVAGEVSIDVSPVQGDPEATIQKARTIQAAANAPANPSAQDRAVSAAAASMEQAAQRELEARQRALADYAAPESTPDPSLDVAA